MPKKGKNVQLISKSDRQLLHGVGVVAGIVVIILFLLAISPVGGNLAFYSKWIECGHKPLVGAGAYKGPGWYEDTKSFEIIRGTSTYFCTALEAEQAGYSASSTQYYFPELEKQN